VRGVRRDADVIMVADQSWSLEELARHANGRPKEEKPAAAAPGNEIREGHRHAELKRHAARLRAAGLMEVEILAALRAINESRCRPPSPDGELRKLAEYFDGKNGAPAGPVIEVVEPLPLITWDALMDLEVPPQRFVVEGLVLANANNSLLGRWGARKTWVLAHMALCVAVGRPFLDRFPVTQGTVLFIALEGGVAEHQRRLKALGGDLRGIPLLSFEGLLRAERAEDQARLASAIREHKPDLILLDHLRAAFLGDENDSERATLIHRFLQEMRAIHPSAWLAVGHLGKDPARGSRGSSAIEDFGDSIIMVEKVGDGDHGRLIHKKLKGGKELDPIEFVFTGPEMPGGASLVHVESGTADPELKADGPSGMDHAILQTLGARPSRMIWRKELVQAFGGEKSGRKVDGAIGRLEKRGQVKKVRPPRGIEIAIALVEGAEGSVLDG
jgi:hypothetical protein